MPCICVNGENDQLVVDEVRVVYGGCTIPFERVVSCTLHFSHDDNMLGVFDFRFELIADSKAKIFLNKIKPKAPFKERRELGNLLLAFIAKAIIPPVAERMTRRIMDEGFEFSVNHLKVNRVGIHKKKYLGLFGAYVPLPWNAIHSVDMRFGKLVIRKCQPVNVTAQPYSSIMGVHANAAIMPEVFQLVKARG